MNIYYLLIIPIIVGAFLQEFFKKKFQNEREEHKNMPSVILYSLTLTSASFIALTILWAFNGFENIIYPTTVTIAFAFGVLYVVATIYSLLALFSGPFALTALILSYSLILPTGFGLIFYSGGNAPSVFVISGIILIFVSLFLVRTKSDNAGVKITGKWIIYSVIAFASNGTLNILQTIHNEENAKNSINVEPYIFMLWSMFFVVVSFAIIALIYFTKNKNKGLAMPNTSSLLKFGCATGVSNTVMNVLVLTVNGIYVPAFILFPLMSVGQLTLIFFVSVLFFNERYSTSQYIGYFLGMISIVLLNIG
ncbi:MAG: hypothetical protein E7628_02540 [Ruminococcaceae bacterium]|nr:hypothetical protein [Oscillospiraceae bacterium]